WRPSAARQPVNCPGRPYVGITTETVGWCVDGIGGLAETEERGR
ncbi:MAG: hypothetical protein RLZZ111_1833, partial [Planctomycetota bacterium]